MNNNNNSGIVVYRSQREKVLDEFIATHPEVHIIGGLLFLVVCVFVICRKSRD